jgi:voltage-gated potassium channel
LKKPKESWSKRFRRFRNHFRNSLILRPVLIFLSIFGLLAVIVYFAELTQGNPEFEHFGDSLWWSIITFSTTGYGDKVTQSFPGQIATAITILVGIAATSFISGIFASRLVDNNTRARRGLVNIPNIQDHIIVCGWKDHMKEILMEIINISQEYLAEDIVIISNVDSEKVETIREEKDLNGVRFVRGDYFSETSLARANVQKASKVLVLADSFESHSATEIDSKTVMTVLSVKTLAKECYVCAELMDRKYEGNLRNALCDEILYIRDFGQKMLTNTTVVNGMSHILYMMMNRQEGGARISTLDIPHKYVGQAFGEYKKELADQQNLLLGILENTGSPRGMKLEALREAQKTSDVSLLVNNLQKAKGLEVNKPVFLPADDYIIQPHSKAIVLEKI